MKKIIATTVSALIACTTYAGSMGEVDPQMSSFYVGAFGGGGTLSGPTAAQLGTAYLSSGPLAVNSFGQLNNTSEWLVGGHAGYAWASKPLFESSHWSVMPATEIEGFYIGPNNVTGSEFNNASATFEHNFLLNYQMSSGVGLINAIANFKHANYERWSPYVGFGVGGATVSVSNATSTQVSPQEPGINHYNSSNRDSASTFALQTKVGLSYDLTQHFSVFGEYRYLYFGGMDFTFGSTVYPTHPVTSTWNVRLGAQNYNMGVGGIRYIF